jgi:GNAT superfamily N-acetyltransferase
MKQLIFSKMTEQDLPGLRDLQPEFWSDIIPANRWYLTLDFCYLIKVEHNGRMVGTGAALVHEDAVWLANIIVHKGYRNHGIGYAITEHLIQYAQQYSDNILLIATKLGRPIYTKFGFKDDEEYVFFKPHQINHPYSSNIIPYEKQYAEAILNLDREVMGENRRQLLLPRLQEAFVFVNDTQFEGFCIPTLGEGLTLARSAEAGLALLASRLHEPKRACLPKANPIAVRFLLANGFEKDETLWGIKMYLNKKPEWKPAFQYGRVGGNMG